MKRVHKNRVVVAVVLVADAVEGVDVTSCVAFVR